MKLEIEAIENGFIVREFRSEHFEEFTTTVYQCGQTDQLARLVDSFVGEWATRNDVNDLDQDDVRMLDANPEA